MAEFYIIVEKTDNKLIIVDNNSLENVEKNVSPTQYINGNQSGKFVVKVMIVSSDEDFQVDGKKIKLVLDAPAGDKIVSVVSDADSFAKAIATTDTTGATTDTTGATTDTTGADITDATTDTTGADITGGSVGGQKEKKHKKRNYSKKNRKSRSNNDTLRNYFNYNSIETAN